MFNHVLQETLKSFPVRFVYTYNEQGGADGVYEGGGFFNVCKIQIPTILCQNLQDGHRETIDIFVGILTERSEEGSESKKLVGLCAEPQPFM